MTRAAQTSPLLLRMIIIAGNKAWQAMGARRFARMQLRASKADLRTIDLPDVAEELQRAHLASISQGFDENCRTLYEAFGDWTSDLNACPLPLEAIHGEDDVCTEIADVQRVAQRTEARMTVTKVSDAGYLLPMGHPEVLIDRVRAAHAEAQAGVI